MRFVALFGFLAATLAAPADHEASPLVARQASSNSSNSGSCNTPLDRSCWLDGFDINTDYETSTPLTGVTRRYTFTLTEEYNWLGPDGVRKGFVQLVNGQFPGPTIEVNWGDRVEVVVENRLANNGTSIHWHGIRQLNNNLQDGVNGVTECPIPPGGSRTYNFLAEQYGTTWYHSHFSAQYGNGVSGPIVVHGPASVPYDIDLGAFPVTDWYYLSADELVRVTSNGPPPPSDNVFFNGTNIHPVTGEGEYARVRLQPGRRHRLRIINHSVDNSFQLSLVNHSMTVIANDNVAVNAFAVDSLFVGVGQRYDVVIEADREVASYWFNATFGGGGLCGASINPFPAAIFSYEGASDELPTDAGVQPRDHQCLDLFDLTPVIPRTAPVADFRPIPENTLPVTLDTSGTPLIVWRVNGSAINVTWEEPVMQMVLQGNTSYRRSDNIIELNTRDEWTFWLIENDDPTNTRVPSVPHPMHLHGHDFLLVGRSPDTDPAAQTQYRFDPQVDTTRLRSSNPVRRDVAMLPARGWLLMAFRTDNPGAWLMHCHIAWHVSGGLSVDYLERPADLRAQVSAADRAALDQNCAAWNAYVPTAPYPKEDSGLRQASSFRSGVKRSIRV